MSLNSILGVGIAGMFTASRSLLTTSHNIANASTEGFSRQSALSTARIGKVSTEGVLGGGSDIASINRKTDAFLLRRVRAQASVLSEYEEIDMSLRDVEMIFGSVDNDHLSSSLSNFFTAWSELSAAPTQESLRESVFLSARMLASDFNSMSDSLDKVTEDLDNRIEAAVGELNGMLESVARINQQVILSESGGAEANDLRDSRDLLLRKISQLAHAEVIEREDGSMDVVIGGRTMVTRDHVESFSVEHEVVEGQSRAGTSIRAGARKYDVDLPSGRLRGMITARDEKIIGTRERLDDLATELMDRVNALHTQGKTSGGSGIMFFAGDSAGSIRVSAAVSNNRDLIVTSRSGLAGDMDIAREIAALGGIGNVDDGTETINDLYTDLVIEMASQSAGSRDMMEIQTAVMDSLDQRLESIRGVSLDEEAVNMARYQNAYDASARMIAAAQEMFDTLLTMI